MADLCRVREEVTANGRRYVRRYVLQHRACFAGGEGSLQTWAISYTMIVASPSPPL